MLILFDIDMTLLESKHIGMTCLRNSGRALFDPSFSTEGIRFGGGIDPIIISEMLTQNNIEPTPAHIQSMRSSYHRMLDTIAQTQPVSTPLPGAHDLVNAVLEHPSKPAVGLLTGNFQETGTIKIKSAGFNPSHFTINAWGDSSPHPNPVRAHLPPVAMEKYQAVKGKAIDPQSVVVLGDTEHDVSCALDSGCTSLAVATGHSTKVELTKAGAHHVLDDLTNTEGIIQWLNSVWHQSPRANASNHSMP